MNTDENVCTAGHDTPCKIYKLCIDDEIQSFCISQESIYIYDEKC